MSFLFERRSRGIAVPKASAGKRAAGLLALGVAAGAALAAPAAARASNPPACTVQRVTFEGWQGAVQMQNQWVRLDIVPQLAGRLMQVTFNGHAFLFNNKALLGKDLPPDTVHHSWHNYGGDKIWPMPEMGPQDEKHWAGAGGEPLDDMPFQVSVLADGTKPGPGGPDANGPECTVRLTGPVDPQIGQRYIRDITLGSDSPRIHFHAVMKNVSGFPQAWGEQSVSQYNAADPGDPSQFNPKFWGIVPANPDSAYLDGYHVRDGRAGSSEYTVQDGLFRLHWGPFGGEVWTDTTGGWVAVVDGSSGYTMIERYQYKPGAHYPGKSTVLFFTTGVRHPRPGETKRPPRPPIYYMEAEVNSPVVMLAPGQSYAMDTTWYPTRMGSAFSTADWGGVVGQPLAAHNNRAPANPAPAAQPNAAAPESLTLTGTFGVFYPGHLVVHFYGEQGYAHGTQVIGEADPAKLVRLDTTIQAPAGTARVSLHVVDAQGIDRGPLGEAFVQPAPPHRSFAGY